MNNMLQILNGYEKRQIIKSVVNDELTSKSTLNVAELDGEIDESIFKTIISSSEKAKKYFEDFFLLRNTQFFDAVYINNIDEIEAEVISFDKLDFDSFINSLKIINEENDPIGVMIRINKKNITVNRFTLPIIKKFFNNRSKKVKIIIYKAEKDIDVDKLNNIKSSLNKIFDDVYQLMSIGTKRDIVSEEVDKIIVDSESIIVQKKYVDIFNKTVSGKDEGDGFILIGTSFIFHRTTYPMSFLNLNYKPKTTLPTGDHSNISNSGTVCTGSDYSPNSINGIFRMTVMNADSAYSTLDYKLSELLAFEYIIYNLDTKDIIEKYGENSITDEIDLQLIESIEFKDYSEIGGVIPNIQYIKNVAEVFNLIQSSESYEKIKIIDEATKLYIEYFSNIKTKYTDDILLKIYEKIGDTKLSEYNGMKPEIIILDDIKISLDEDYYIVKNNEVVSLSEFSSDSNNINIDDDGLDLSNF